MCDQCRRTRSSKTELYAEFLALSSGTERLLGLVCRKISRKFTLGRAASANQPFTESGNHGGIAAPLRRIKEIPARSHGRLRDWRQEPPHAQLIADKRYGADEDPKAFKRRLDRKIEVLEHLIACGFKIGEVSCGQPSWPRVAQCCRMEECVLPEIRRRPQRASFHQVRAQHRQACLAEKAVSNPTGLTRGARDHRVHIHAELLGRRARCDNPQFHARMAALEVRHARNEPAHRKSRQRRYAKQSRRRARVRKR